MINQRLERLVRPTTQVTRALVKLMRLIVLVKVTAVGCSETAALALKHHSRVTTSMCVQISCNRTEHPTLFRCVCQSFNYLSQTLTSKRQKRAQEDVSSSAT